MTGTNHLAATTTVSRLDNESTRLHQVMLEALLEVDITAPSDGGLCQVFPADPHNTFGSAESTGILLHNRSQLTIRSWLVESPVMQPQIQQHDYKVDHLTPAKAVLVPSAHLDTFTPEHGVSYGQSMTSTEIQQQNTARVQVKGTILSNHAPPGLSVIANVSFEITEEDEGISRGGTL